MWPEAVLLFSLYPASEINMEDLMENFNHVMIGQMLCRSF